jgi:hypothetical protein
MSKRTAHEVHEILNGDRDHLAFQPSDADLRVLQSGPGAGVLEAVGVAALIAKLAGGSSWHLRQDDIFKLTAVEHGLQPLRGADAHVIFERNDELVGLNVLVKTGCPVSPDI